MKDDGADARIIHCFFYCLDSLGPVSYTHLCEDAAKLVKIDYDVQEGVFDPREALKPGAYVVSSENKDNVVMRSGVHCGDVEEGFKQADLIIENNYYVPAVDHAYLEQMCIRDRPSSL